MKDTRSARRFLLLLGPLLGAGACRQDVPLPDVSASDGPSRPPRDASVWDSRGISTGSTLDTSEPPSPTDSGSSPECRRTASFSQENPQIILAVDRSSSMMNERPSGSMVSRLAGLQQTLVRLMRIYRPAIHFGYVEFPMSACRDGATCCSGSFLPPAPYPIDSIESRWSCPQSGCSARSDDSPASAALRDARLYYSRAEERRGSRHVLLFTDGEPSCAAIPRAESCQDAVKEVADLSGAAKARTTVFGLKQDLTSNACLNDMAALGAQGGTLHVSGDEATMKGQIETFLKGLSAEACNFRLHQPLQPGQNIKVTLEDEELKRDATRTDGWEFVEGSMSRFTVHGPWCDKLRASAVADADVYLCPR